MVDPVSTVVAGNAAVSAVSTGWSFAKAFAGSEPNSAILAKLEGYASSNGLCGPTTGPVCADSPLLECLYRTLVGPGDRCAVGNYVFYTKRNLGKSAALRIFCRKTLKKAGSNRSPGSRPSYVSYLHTPSSHSINWSKLHDARWCVKMLVFVSFIEHHSHHDCNYHPIIAFR